MQMPQNEQKLELESTKAKMWDAMRIRIMKGTVSRVQGSDDCRCSFAIVAGEKEDDEIEERTRYKP